MFNITGILKAKFDEQRISEKFRKRDFVITDNSSQYPQQISFQLVQDRCSLIDGYNAGDEIRVFFNLRGREWTKDGVTKYFNTIEAWKIEAVNAAAPQNMGNPGSMASNPMPAQNVSTFAADGGDDLPF
jgi:single-strand DNA-binding protein